MELVTPLLFSLTYSALRTVISNFISKLKMLIPKKSIWTHSALAILGVSHNKSMISTKDLLVLRKSLALEMNDIVTSKKTITKWLRNIICQMGCDKLFFFLLKFILIKNRILTSKVWKKIKTEATNDMKSTNVSLLFALENISSSLFKWYCYIL